MLRRFVFHLGCVRKEICDFVLCSMQGFAEGSILRTEVVVALLRACEFRLQAKELMHDRLALCKGLLKLFFQQNLHG